MTLPPSLRTSTPHWATNPLHQKEHSILEHREVVSSVLCPLILISTSTHVSLFVKPCTMVLPSPSSLLFFLSAVGLVAGQTRPTRCYVLSGIAKIDAGYRCNNATTGHSSCCAAGAVCYSNGVCQQSNGPVQDYLRVGCTDPTWSDPACLQQCETCMFALTPTLSCEIKAN